jgi:hypothetical protein
MDKKKFKKIVNNPRHIPGIHNYCDRWCERCTKTLRCSVFAVTEAEGMNNPESRDPDNEAFWEYMHGIFSVTMEMVQDYAEKHNIDLNTPLSPEEVAREEQLDKEADEHYLVTAGMSYTKQVRNWFDSNKHIFEQTAEQFKSRLEMELPADNPESEWLNLQDAIEIIQWYFMFIVVKLRRAVHGLLDPLDLPEEDLKDIPSDADGSAKIALIGIDRSISAWAVILKSMPEQEKEILEFLVQLERLRRQAEQTFPKALAFIRPGFDD